MFIYHRHIFVSYIIQQNNPLSESLRYIIPWFLRNRSYRRRAPSYRRHPIKLPSSVIWDKFAYRRLAANLSGIIVQKREKVRVCRFGARRTMPPCFSVVNLREMVAEKHEQAKTSRSERPRRRHLDDGSFVRLSPVTKQVDRSLNIQALLAVYCSAMDTSSAVKTCE